MESPEPVAEEAPEPVDETAPAETDVATPAIAGAGAAEDDVARVERLAEARARILEEVKKRIVGQEDVIEKMLICLFARATRSSWACPGSPRPC
jgi:hypothetical protein